MKTLIRHAEPEDAKALQRIHDTEEAISGTMQLPFPSEALWKKRLAEKPDNLYLLVAEIEGEVQGVLGLQVESKLPRRRHTANLGLVVHTDWHRKGLGSKLLESALDMADNWLNLTRIELIVFTDNVAAQKLYGKFGFEQEGTLRQYAFKAGKLCDAYTMARIKP